MLQVNTCKKKVFKGNLRYIPNLVFNELTHSILPHNAGVLHNHKVDIPDP
jgi:hypothetical protein